MPSVQRGVLWAVVDQVSPLLVTFVVSIVLARLLSPAEYGLIGMLSVFLALANIFVDSGLSAALIQRQTITPDDETSVFVLNIAVAAALVLLLCGVSPLVARFYRQPVLRPMLCVLATQILLGSFAIVQTTLLRRSMDFRALALAGTAAAVAAGVVGVGMARLGWGVWSLVGSSVAGVGLRSGLLWLLSGWRPRGRFVAARVRLLWPFSSNLLATASLNTLFDNLYSVVIGRVYPVSELGIYSRANQLQNLPASIIVGVANRVGLPILARYQAAPAAMLGAVRSMALVTFCLSALGMAALIAASQDLVILLLGAKWRETIPVFRVLAVGGALMPLQIIQVTALLSRGESRLVLRLEFIKKAMLVAVVVLTFRRGIVCMAWGSVAFAVAAYYLNAYYNVRQIAYTWRLQCADLLPVALAAASVAVAVWPLRYMAAAPLVRVSAQLLAAGLLYASVLYLGRHGAFALCWTTLTSGASRLVRGGGR